MRILSNLKIDSPFVYGHSLSDQIGGQAQAGFVLTNLYEDHHPNPTLFMIDKYVPVMIATRSVKM